jgi:hypothetical protein
MLIPPHSPASDSPTIQNLNFVCTVQEIYLHWILQGKMWTAVVRGKGGSTIQHTFKWIKQPDAAISQVYYLSFRYSSTCFGYHNAQHQEPQQLQ